MHLKNAYSRPQAAEVLCHPFFWDSEKRGLFLRDVCEWLEHDDIKRNYVANAIMDAAPKVLTENWDVKMEAGFLTYASHHKYYSYDSVLDLLLLIGNTLSHQPRLPKDIQVSVSISVCYAKHVFSFTLLTEPVRFFMLIKCMSSMIETSRFVMLNIRVFNSFFA